MGLRLTSLLLLGCVATAAAHANEAGRPRIDYYELGDYGATDYNYGLAQDEEGRIWVANERPMLVYDGVRWLSLRDRHDRGGIHGPLVMGSRVYAAPTGDLGYYEADGRGGYAWHSLRERLPPEARSFVRVIGPVAGGGAVWFLTTAHLVRIGTDGDAQVLPAGRLAPWLLGDADGVWLHDPQGGLLRGKLANARIALSPVPGTEGLGPLVLTGAATLADGALLLASSNGQMWRYGSTLEPYAPSLWPLLASLRPGCVLPLRDGNIALGFIRAGVWVIDAQGQVVERYDAAEGARILSVSDVIEDREGGLWVSQIGGLARIDRGHGVTRFGIESGLPQALVVARHEGRLYAAGRTGVYVQDPGTHGTAARFRRLLEQPTGAADLESRGGRLWIVGGKLVRVRIGPAGEVLAQDTVAGITQARRMAASPHHADRVYLIGIDGGIDVLDAADTDAPLHRRIEGIAGTTSKIVVDAQESVWVPSVDGTVWRARPDLPGDRPTQFGARHGLPGNGRTEVDALGGEVVFPSSRGLLRFVAATERFQAVAGLDGPLAAAEIAEVYADAEGNWYAWGPSALGLWRGAGTARRWDGETLSVLSPRHAVHDFLREGQVLWVSRSDGLERVDLARQNRAVLPGPALASVRDTRARRRLPLDAAPAPEQGGARDLAFALSLPVYSGGTAASFRSRLVGYDPRWSEWSARTERGYTNLPDGAFRFEAQARDGYGRVAAIAPYGFRIAPPWWRTPGAYAAGVLALVLSLLAALWLGGRWRQRALLARQRELEAVVATRTHELLDSNTALADKNEQLAVQADRLLELDRLKTRFFVNVGHEFRTPLTLVLGPLDDLLRDHAARLLPRVREQLEMAHRNARRVLDLIIEILDVNRLEQGKLKFRRERHSLQVLVRRAVDAARPLAARYGHELALAMPQHDELQAEVDPAQIERCLSNLIGNAAKFMQRNGRIEVALAAAEDGATLSVRDHGRGIDPAALPHVFDRFHQVEAGDAASGYGVGLALVREIVEGHGGRVEVESELGAGACFRIWLPPASAAAGIGGEGADVPATSVESAVEAAVDPASVGTPRPRPLVLVVDDHDDIRHRLRQLFESRYEVAQAGDGPVAWRVACELLPDVVVCDVMMPGFDGVELTRRLRANPDTSAIALLLLTAKTGSEHAVVGLQAGANDYLEKPFDSSELLARVDGLLAQSQRLRRQLALERERAAAPPSQEPSPAARWQGKLDRLLEQKLDDSGFGVDEIAQAMHIDRTQLFRRCKQQVGMSPSEYLRERRLARARELLMAGAGSVTEVAYAVGFESLSSFTRAFRARYETAPSAVRETRVAAGGR